MIYLDNCATTKLSEKVKQNIVDNLNTFGNPSSSYNLGLQSARIIQESREIIAQCINCDPQEIYFTSGASESNTWALQEPFWCNDYEHHSITNNSHRVQTKDKAEIITYMMVNNEVGFINDIKLLREKYQDFKFHCDATQAIGNVKIDVKDLSIDTMAFSGHKFHAPKGIGVLYVKGGKIKPLIYGGKQENGVRGGTENILGISAIGVAIKDACENIDKKSEHCKTLKDRLVYNLNKSGIDYIINGQNLNTINSTLSISIKNIESEPILLQLDMKNIYISSGSACNSGSLEPSETLRWLNIPKEYINGTLRVSFDLDNTIDEIDVFSKELSKIVNRIS